MSHLLVNQSLTYTLGGVYRPSLQILTLFQTRKDISYTLLFAGGGVLTYTLGGGVLPKPSNPDPIWDPRRHLIHSIFSQGEEYLPTLWVGVCRPSHQILTLFQTRKDISYTLLLARGRSTHLHFGWGVPPKPSNPDPIWDPKRHFLHSIFSQGEEYLPTLWVGVCRPSLQILTLFQTRKINFLYPIRKSMPYFGRYERRMTINRQMKTPWLHQCRPYFTFWPFFKYLRSDEHNGNLSAANSKLQSTHLLRSRSLFQSFQAK